MAHTRVEAWVFSVRYIWEACGWDSKDCKEGGTFKYMARCHWYKLLRAPQNGLTLMSRISASALNFEEHCRPARAHGTCGWCIGGAWERRRALPW
jgi:hypothetical protein